MDITPVFKACVKTVRTRNKAFGEQDRDRERGDRSRILRERPKNAFLAKAKDISSQVTRLRDFLITNRAAYLDLGMGGAGEQRLTDAERQQLDAGFSSIASSCARALRSLKKDAPATSLPTDFSEAVMRLLEGYLKAVCGLHAEQKAARVKRALELRQLSRLEPAAASPRRSPAAPTPALSRSALAVEQDMAAPPDKQLSPEELQVFESENLLLYEELNSLSEEVRQIESKVLRIADLQEAFTEKVLQQEGDIDRIAGTVLSATENVRDANQQLKQAIQRNAGLRTWLLFFLLVMSASLLFLDWYND